ncbi:MAG TPA: sigma-70 family RNA polymerase sigma factor [Vicinamibacterales bacterium]|nr:sigma-70 family RNA polymerase sigma factor [Vicinamibacterales bacterium]
MIPQKLIAELYRAAHADRWTIPIERFADALRMSADHAAPADLTRYLRGLHLEDLALACGCAAGDQGAWDHFVREHRPILYRAADALDPSGGAREIADSIYGELYGVREREGERLSLFRYYHGRSSLKTWLRAVLAQRHVDGIRAVRRLDPLPEEESADTLSASTPFAPDPDRVRYRALIQRAFKSAVSALTDRDRLRLACYYTQQLTLAETGRVLKEHEATVSRQLAKTRQVLRREVERHLRDEDRLDAAEIEQCFAYVLEDPGPMDLGGMLRKNSASDRSI